MNAQTAELWMRCHRPGRDADSRTQKAVRFAQQDADLGKALAEQMSFDEEMVDVIHYINPPEDLRKKLGRSGGLPRDGRTPLRRQMINPAVLTAIVGVLLLAGTVIFLVMEAMEKFPGREGVEKLLGASGKMTGQELELASGTANQLGDWFYMRGYEGYETLPELAALPVIGSRVFHHDGRAVAQVAVGSAEGLRCLIYEFHAGASGVQLPPDGDWLLMQQDAWAGAIRQRGDLCFLVALRGTKTEMREFLRTLPDK